MSSKKQLEVSSVRLAFAALTAFEKILFFLLSAVLVASVLISSRWIIDGNILFHSDIARDFLLLEEMVQTSKPALIGARTGGIQGVFHGPLWLYLNLPAFILGKGDPWIVGWWWYLLTMITVATISWVAKKLFGMKEALLTAVLVMTMNITSSHHHLNPFGAYLVFPLFFYFYSQYCLNKQFKYLVVSLLLIGAIIQFQMALGIPLLFLTAIHAVFQIASSKKYNHLFSFISLSLPLSTYIAFELRHNFLETRAVANHIFNRNTPVSDSMLNLLSGRMREASMGITALITAHPATFLNIAVAVLLGIAMYSLIKTKTPGFWLFLYFYLGFWVVSLLFSGSIAPWYYFSFIPVIVIYISSLYKSNRRLLFALYIPLVLLNFQNGAQDAYLYNTDPSVQIDSTWRFNKLVAQKVFADAPSDFGYYVFTPDLYGYSPRYAMDWLQTRSSQKTTHPYEKMETTYLLTAPTPADKNNLSDHWRREEVRILSEPVEIFKFTNGFTIEKYHLTAEEIKVPHNPLLIDSLFFR